MSVVGELEVLHSTFHWKIKNFSTIDTSIHARSPVFYTTQLCTEQLKWQLKLYPSGFRQESKEYMGLYLHYLGERQVSVSYSLSIIDEKQNKVNEFKTSEKLYTKYQCWGTDKLCSKMMVRDETKRLLTNDTLLISCTITARYITLVDEHYDANVGIKLHFAKLLESGDLSDVTFEIENKQMRLHKAIVTSLSPVFFAMFQHQMQENEDNVVRITDVKYDIMKELFRYIYVRKVKNLGSIAGDLLVAADKYDVQGLKVLCEDILTQNLDVVNALQHLELAIKYNTTCLKPKVIEFIVSRLEEFVERSEFEQMDGSYKDELFRAMARKKVKTAT